MTKRFCVLMLISFSFLLTSNTFAQGDAKRSITQVQGDVYRFQNNFHFAMVVLTEEGIVITDPINADAATWLKEELKGMTDKPITHLIYSHSHGDHASGGAVLADGATVIAQANAPDKIDGVEPTVRFEDEFVFSSGSKEFELTWLGPGHGDDLIAVVVRPENVAFITDAAAPKRLPYRDFGRANVDDWINQVRKIESLDFSIFAPAHGNVGTKADATDVRVYMENLRAEVLAGLKAGKSKDELSAELNMEDYKDWGRYEDWFPLNVEGMANFLVYSGQVN